MNKITIVFLIVGCIATFVASTPAKLRDTENVSVSLESTEKDENTLEGRIKSLREKVNKLVEQGKENEEAFNNMQVKVDAMKTKVKIMLEKLKKINKTDYLNTNAQDIENL